jgi:hypothetical protein
MDTFLPMEIGSHYTNEPGVSEIYVIPFPPFSNGGKWLVSRGGGVMPRWRRDGKELFYISPDSKMMEGSGQHPPGVPVWHSATLIRH